MSSYVSYYVVIIGPFRLVTTVLHQMTARGSEAWNYSTFTLSKLWIINNNTHKKLPALGVTTNPYVGSSCQPGQVSI